MGLNRVRVRGLFHPGDGIMEHSLTGCFIHVQYNCSFKVEIFNIMYTSSPQDCVTCFTKSTTQIMSTRNFITSPDGKKLRYVQLSRLKQELR